MSVVSVQVQVPEEFKETIQGIASVLCQNKGEPPVESFNPEEFLLDVRGTLRQFTDAYGDRESPLSDDDACLEMGLLTGIPSEEFVLLDGVPWPLLGLFSLVREYQEGAVPHIKPEDTFLAKEVFEEAGLLVGSGVDRRLLPRGWWEAQEGLKVEVILDLMKQYGGPGQGPRKMARAAHSRMRDWFVECDGVRWPLKALYFLTMKVFEPGKYKSPSEFHTEEAQEFMASLNFRVLCISKGKVVWQTEDKVGAFDRSDKETVFFTLRIDDDDNFVVVEVMDSYSNDVTLTPLELRCLRIRMGVEDVPSGEEPPQLLNLGICDRLRRACASGCTPVQAWEVGVCIP